MGPTSAGFEVHFCEGEGFALVYLLSYEWGNKVCSICRSGIVDIDLMMVLIRPAASGELALKAEDGPFAFFAAVTTQLVILIDFCFSKQVA